MLIFLLGGGSNCSKSFLALTVVVSKPVRRLELLRELTCCRESDCLMGLFYVLALTTCLRGTPRLT